MRYSLAMFVRVLMLLFMPAGLASCLSGRAFTAGQVPPDFALSLTVMPAGSHVDAHPPSWFLLDADGSLRARLGVRTTSSAVPPIVRTLSTEDRAQLLALVEGAAGDGPIRNALSDEAHALHSPTPGLILLFWQRQGVRATSLSRPDDKDQEQRNSMIALATRLRRLAWLDDAPPPTP